MSRETRITADWIAVDWGTTHVRAWAMSDGDDVLATAQSSAGAGGLTRNDFESALLDLVGEWLGERVTQVICCGMVGSRQGWAEATYLQVPTPPQSGEPVVAPSSDLRLQVFILNGIKQINPADVMRGEETQIAGLLALEADFDGIACLPGTHTKWVHVVGGEVFHFATFMTGEMFSLLSQKSILRHSLSNEGLEEASFVAALERAMAKPERVANRLFGLRAEGLLDNLDPLVARSRLSGMLIGLEIAAAKPYWLGQELRLIGDAKLCEIYRLALSHLALEVTILDGTDTTLAGLIRGYRSIETTGETPCTVN